MEEAKPSESVAPSTDEIPFLLGKSKYDLSTYTGRVRHFFNVIDPRTLLTTNAELKNAQDLLTAFKNGNLPADVTNEDLWRAQKIVQSMIHPDTGEKIPMPFRMSGYVPFGSPIVAGMLLPNPTLGSIVFWQWLNQSHNACVNYCNRNATRPTSKSQFIQGYLGAVTAAVGVAVGLNQMVTKARKLSPATRSLVKKFIPFPAVAIANVCNVVLMRRQELKTGIEVYEESPQNAQSTQSAQNTKSTKNTENIKNTKNTKNTKNSENSENTKSEKKIIGISQIAAFDAIKETSLTRIFLPAPILTIPPLIMAGLEKTSLFRRFPKSYLPVNASLGALAFGLALPLAIGLFPQESKMPREKLEKELQEKTQDEFVLYNKGL